MPARKTNRPIRPKPLIPTFIFSINKLLKINDSNFKVERQIKFAYPT